MKTCINPLPRPGGVPLVVRNPVTNKPFPQGRWFDLSDAQFKTPSIRRLFPPHVAGGRFGDLLLEPSAAKDRKALDDALERVRHEVEAAPVEEAAAESEPVAAEADDDTSTPKGRKAS